MPQFDFSTFAPQIVWLVLVFALLYFGIAKTSLPKVGAVIANREQHVKSLLSAAEEARAKAAAAESAANEQLAIARQKALAMQAEAKAASVKSMDQKLAKLDSELAKKASEAEAAIQEAQAKSMAEIDAVAADAAVAIVTKLTGLSVSTDEAARVVASVKA